MAGQRQGCWSLKLLVILSLLGLTEEFGKRLPRNSGDLFMVSPALWDRAAGIGSSDPDKDKQTRMDG